MTRNTTSYREKGRAVVLAALMVLSVVAMGAAFAAPAAADHADDEKEIGSNGGSIIQGQTAIVNVSTLNPTDGTVELYEDTDDGQSHQFTVDVNSTSETATFQTDTLDAGSYFLSDGDSSTDDISIEVRELSLTAGADGGTMFLQSSVETGETAQLQLDSNQGDFVAEISSEDFSQSQLDSMISGASTSDHGGFVVVDNADTTVDVDFSEVDASAGEYNFTVAGAGTTAEVTTSIQLTEPGQEVIEFDESVVEGVEGDRTWVTVNMQEADKAQLNLTWSPDDEPITVLSGNITADESQVKIPINTHELFKGDGDAIVDKDAVNGTFTPTDAMDASTYDSSAEEIWGLTSTLNMELYDANGNQEDRGTFRVTDRSTEGMSIYKVSQGVVDNTDGSNINNVEENGAPVDGSIAGGDNLAVVIEGSGFFGYADSVQSLENNGAYLNLTHQNPPWDGNPSTLTPATDFYTNEDNGTIVAFYEAPTDQVGNEYEVSFDVYNKEAASNGEAANYSHYTEKTESFSSTFTIEEPSFALDSDSFNVAADSGQEITGTTNVAPGAEVDVVTETPDASDNPIFETATAEVAADGTWTATLDYSDAVQDTEFGIEATLLGYETSGGDTLSDTADGIIGEGTGAAGILDVSTDAPSEVTVGDDASLTVTLENTGDSAATGTVSITVDGEEVTSEEVELKSGATQEFTHDFDTSSAGDIEYSVTTTGDDDEEDDSASGTLTVAEESSDGEDGTDGEDGSDGEDGEDDDSSGSPGFGVAVALVALLSAAMLALRRQN